MNIILEGCDCTGKSTIARYLCEQLGLYYWHESEPRSLKEYRQMLSSGGVVFDRFCFGQFVYNSPEERKLSKEELKQLIQEFKSTQSLLLFVDAPSDLIFKRMVERGEADESNQIEAIKWIKNIRGTYRQIFRESGAEYIELNGEKALCLII